MLSSFANCFKIPELKQKILFTLGIIVAYRIGCYMPTPGVNGSVLAEFFNKMNASGNGSVFGIMNMFSGGALEKMILPFKLFVGGPLGSGRQWFPWIHRDDAIGIILSALENDSVKGPINLAAPESVTMKEFSIALGKAMSRPVWAPVPAFALRIALGEMAELLLTGQYATSGKIQDAGFRFQFPTLDAALEAIVKQPQTFP